MRREGVYRACFWSKPQRAESKHHRWKASGSSFWVPNGTQGLKIEKVSCVYTGEREYCEYELHAKELGLY
jgi:hypothetical protein